MMTYSADSNTSRFCMHCGNPVSGKFCTNCGAPVDGVAPQPTTQPATQPATVEPAATITSNKRPLWRLISDIALFVAILLLCIAPFSGFVRQATVMGTSATYSESIGLFDYLFTDGENSMIYSFTKAVESLEDMGSSAEQALEGLGGVMTIFSNCFVAGAAISTFFISFIGIIASIVRFCKKRSHKLSSQVFKAMACIFTTFILLSFFASISGGSGENAYYIGYEVAPETSGALIIAFVLVLASMVVNFVFNRKEIWQHKRACFLKNASIFVGFSLIGILLITIKGYKLFSSSFSSLLTAFAGAISNGFSFTTILYPILNMALFIFCMIMFSKTKNAVSSSGMSLLYTIYAPESTVTNLKIKVVEPKTRHLSEVIITSLAIISMFVLNIPSIGYGWDVAIYEQFVGMLLISALIWIANAFVDNAFGSGVAAPTAPQGAPAAPVTAAATQPAVNPRQGTYVNTSREPADIPTSSAPADDEF